MNAQEEIKKALIHMRKVQTWLSKTSEDDVTLDKKLTWPEEAKMLKLEPKKMYTYLEILSTVYEYIDTNSLLLETEESSSNYIKLDKTLQKTLKTSKTKLHLLEVASHLK